MSEGEQKRYEGWAIVQQMGHVTIAGYVTEVQLAGYGVLSVAIPDGDRTIEKLIPPSTLYDLTWVGEEEARRMAKSKPVEPISEWTVRQEVRERLVEQERESIEKQVRRSVAIDEADERQKERGRVLDILSPARALAEAIGEGMTGDYLPGDAKALVQAIDGYLDEGPRRSSYPEPAQIYIDDDDGGYQDDDEDYR